MMEQDVSFGGPAGTFAQVGPSGKPTHYAVLNVAPNATKLAIRESYLRLKQTFGGSNAALYSLISEEEARTNMAAVEEAYRVLQDDVKRAEYDRSLGAVWSEESRISAATFGHTPDVEERLGGLRPHQVIMTTRSTLPIIKTTADQSTSEAVQAKIAAVLADGDPGDGDLFRRLREAVGVSEDEILERTKISREYIRAIESNRYERLPQSVYVKGFLRSYFRYLAVPDHEKLARAFAAKLESWQASKKS
jgi:curved DNA-binding protein CbpA